MTNEITVGTKLNAVHIKLLDKILQKAFSQNQNKCLRLIVRDFEEGEDESHFSLDIEVLGTEESLPPTDDVVELDKITAFSLHFDYDLSTYLERQVLVLTSSATRLFNALFVPFIEVECVVCSEGEGWKIALVRIEEREDESDPADFDEIKY